ncbi:MAG TPA: hypothetical protein VLK84_20530 [Longimicrobium sp.]|nr:hypothetical protein [Longimicrobium sp.]
MKKLKLDLEALEVDTFDPATPDEGDGTVFGEQIGVTAWFSCAHGTCLSCQASCRGTCGASCFVTCQLSCFRTCGQATCGAHTCQFSCLTCFTCGPTCVPQLCGAPSAFAICP